MRTVDTWATRKLGSNAVLILGWRTNRRLHASRLRLARDMDAELRQRARATLATIRERSPRRYEQTAELEEDEVFLLEVADLPTRPQRRRRGRQDEDAEIGDQQAEVSALVSLLGAPGELDPLDADDARGRSFLFYAAVFTDDDGRRPIAFIKRHNTASILNKGWLIGQWGQTVTRVDEPVLVFAQDFDLVIDGDEIASLRSDAIQRLFADVEIAAAAAPALAMDIGDLKKLRLAEEAKQAIAAACGRRRLLARRLQILLDQPHLAEVTPARVADYLRSNGEDPDRFVRNNRLVVAEEDVAEFLDVLNQTHYRGGYDQLLRRADRSSLLDRASR